MKYIKVFSDRAEYEAALESGLDLPNVSLILDEMESGLTGVELNPYIPEEPEPEHQVLCEVYDDGGDVIESYTTEDYDDWGEWNFSVHDPGFVDHIVFYVIDGYDIGDIGEHNFYEVIQYIEFVGDTTPTFGNNFSNCFFSGDGCADGMGKRIGVVVPEGMLQDYLLVFGGADINSEAVFENTSDAIDYTDEGNECGDCY